MRIAYIDKLKGFAIFFVVMGHVTEYGLGVKDSPFNLFYFSFHMPLFMFLSGLFAYKSFKQWNLAESLLFIRKKTLRILLPFFVVGGGYLLLVPKNSTDDYVKLCGVYWFFPALFYCMITGLLIGCIENRLLDKINKYRLSLDLILCCLTVLFNYLLDRYFNMKSIIPYFDDYTAMFPFFYIGVLCSRHESVKSIVFESERMYTLAIAIYFCAMLFLGGSRKVVGCFSIIILVQLFIKYEKHIPSILSQIGQYSLEIYAFHWFLLPSLPSLYNIIATPQATGIPNSNFIMLFAASLIFAIPIVGLCVVLTLCIRKSKFLNMLLFGFKKNNII